MYMYRCCCVCSFLWVASLGGGEGVGVDVWLLCSWVSWVGVVCVFTTHVAVGLGHGFRVGGLVGYTNVFSPPKFSFTPEPVCLDTERRRPPPVPFSGHVSVRSNHAALIDDCDEEECNRLGSVFIGCCVRLTT